ncbi:MAG: glycosyltransferase family 9 protein, partial [Syntrophothermus sp.]
MINLFRLAKDLKKRGYTSVYSPHRSARSSLLVWLSGAEKTFGFSNSSLKFLYSQIIPYRKDFHEVRRNLLMAGFEWRDDGWKILPDINISDSDTEKVERSLNLKGDRNVAIAPSSVWATKRYPASNYAEIIRYLLEKSFNIFLI